MGHIAFATTVGETTNRTVVNGANALAMNPMKQPWSINTIFPPSTTITATNAVVGGGTGIPAATGFLNVNNLGALNFANNTAIRAGGRAGVGSVGMDPMLVFPTPPMADAASK